MKSSNRARGNALLEGKFTLSAIPGRAHVTQYGNRRRPVFIRDDDHAVDGASPAVAAVPPALGIGLDRC
jgi:hypothetical protein